MGIKKFFGYFKNRFADNIRHLKHGESLENLKDDLLMEGEVIIDNLMLDMNGIFHNSAQKVYQYGTHKPPKRLLGKRAQPNVNSRQKQLEFFDDVCKEMEAIVNIVKPKKRIILCVDGPAPLSKQNQQRQRRFMSAIDREESDRSFDSNCITPGTKMMDFLSKYIDWFLRTKMSDDKSIWSTVEVIFSNEKAPGEGEQKIFNYIRKYGNRNESYCLYGMDADLIMLALSSHMPKFYILREDPMDPNFDYYVIDIGGVRYDLGEMMRWDKSIDFDLETAINDFVFMCFTVGNDFLPHIPGIEIIEGGIDFMLDVYKKVGETYGHITRCVNNRIMFNKKALEIFMGTVSQYEKGVMEEKFSHKDNFYPNPILEECTELKDGKPEVNIVDYRAYYYQLNLPNVDEKKLCHEYLEGMQWVLDYYTRGVPNWKWRFRYHYAPFSFTIAKHIESFNFPEYPHTSPTLPFMQLLCVLPPKSAELLPSPLDSLLTSGTSPLAKYCPKEFTIDLSGCRATWEGVVILPVVKYEEVEKIYLQNISKVDEREQKRNITGRSFIYKKDSCSYLFKSYYGDFVSHVTVEPIDLI